MKRLGSIALRGMFLAVIVALGLVIFLTVGGEEGSARTDLSGMNVTALSSAGRSAMYAQVDDPEASGLYRSGDGGRNWQLASRQLGKQVNALAVSPADPRVVYAGTSGGSIALQDNSLYISTDAGRKWSKTPLNLPVDAEGNVPTVLSLAVDHVDAGTLYVGTDGQGIYKLTDKGVTLMALGDEFCGARVDQVVVSPRDSQLLYAVTSTGLFESRDSGESWSQVQTLPEQAVTLAMAPGDSQVLYAGTASMGAYRSVDGGRTWHSIGEGLGLIPGVALSVTSLEVDAQDPFLVYATPSYMLGTSKVHEVPLGVHVSDDGGDSWRELTPAGSTGQVNALLQAPSQEGEILLGTEQGVFWASQDGISEVNAKADKRPVAALGDELAGNAAFGKVSIILLTVMAAAIVNIVKPAKIYH